MAHTLAPSSVNPAPPAEAGTGTPPALKARDFPVIDGCVVDPATGEVLEVLGLGQTVPGEPWEPTDAAGIEWVLRKASEAEARAAMIGERAASLARAKKSAAATVEFFKNRWKEQLLRFARAAVGDGKKGKTVEFTYGALQVRTSERHGVSVADRERAVEYLKKHGPKGAVVTRKVPATTVTELNLATLTEEHLAALAARTAAETGLEVTKPGDSIVVKLPKLSGRGGDEE